MKAAGSHKPAHRSLHTATFEHTVVAATRARCKTSQPALPWVKKDTHRMASGIQAMQSGNQGCLQTPGSIRESKRPRLVLDVNVPAQSQDNICHTKLRLALCEAASGHQSRQHGTPFNHPGYDLTSPQPIEAFLLTPPTSSLEGAPSSSTFTDDHDDKENQAPGLSQQACLSYEDCDYGLLEKDAGPCSRSSSVSALSCQPSIESHILDPLATTDTSCKLARRRCFPSMGVSVDPTSWPAQPPMLQHAVVAAQRAEHLVQSSANAKAQFGWFARCRGCAQMTGNEYSKYAMASTQPLPTVPLCACCSKHLQQLDKGYRAQQEKQLLHIHSSWLAHGI